jgi:hypothetical protein
VARYFFHTANGSRDPDTLGMELPDQAAARVEAIRYAGAILADEPSLLQDGGNFRVEVTGNAQTLLTIVITSVVDVRQFDHD